MLLFDKSPLVVFLFFGVALGILIVLSYAQDNIEYQKAREKDGKEELPPKYPTLVPYLGSILPFLWNCPDFIRRATCYSGKLVSSRVSVGPTWNIYLFQDRDTVKEIWKKSAMMCAGRVHVYACKYLFGMPEKWLSVYAEDNSGQFHKPFPGSNIPPERRMHRILNDGIESALTGPGFDPTLQRFRSIFISQIQNLNAPTGEWIEIKDFRKFIHDTVGLSLVQAIFGPSLLEVNPGFMDDLFEFDKALPWLARGVWSFIMPKPYAIRRRLHQHFKRWYLYARQHFTETSISKDGDGDPFWGSTWMRQRQKILDIIQDDDTLAAGDLGVAWASIANIVSASTMALIHVANDRDLSTRVRDEIKSLTNQHNWAEIDLKRLSTNPFLSSIYAETLRLHVKSFTVVSSPLSDVSLGKYRLPKGDIGLVNSHPAHMDEHFWNTKNGAHPLKSFWADRFLINPADPLSGPRKGAYQNQSPEHLNGQEGSGDGKPYFSLKGLDGSWIPYGGGQLICPGRFLAKNVMVLTCALLTQEFDVEVLTKRIEFDSRSFGFGTEVPKHTIAVRMKRKA
ncbi:cytochrome P450 [Hypoxylon sp. EC38]|nr:cytochrome P450 [Hypoxylon sp. EC38]